MTEKSEPGRPPGVKRDHAIEDLIRRHAERRRERLRSGIRRSRSGDHTIPTWVLTLVLVAMVAGFAYLVITV